MENVYSEELVKRFIRFIWLLNEDTTTYKYLKEVKIINNDCYRYITSYDNDICDLFINIYNDISTNNKDISKLSFIDVGCGIPVIPKIAQLIGFEYNNIFGLENNPHFRYIANVGNFSILDRNYIVQDMREHDFGKYDYIYSYNPLCEESNMKLGLTKIMDTMKSGATFFFSRSDDIDDLYLKNLKFFKFTEKYSYLYIYKKE